MPYLPLPNFNHDSGPRRIQSGPDHEGYVVLYSGVQSTGADDGFAVLGAPLSGTAALGAWDYDSNWRYIPSTLPGQSGVLDPTPHNVSGALDTYDATRIYTRDNVAGAQAASAIGPETGKVNPRGGALQARSDVTRPETYMYYGGAAPDNQDYSPYNTPDANSAAEGKTGGGVTHRAYESSLLTNVLGSQGTSDRSQWRYHQPVYCKTYTETRRSETPGLMSTPLRYVYRGAASSYNYNYGSELLANKGGFELLPYEKFDGGCDIPPGCPVRIGPYLTPASGDLLTAQVYCIYDNIEWFNSSGTAPIGSGEQYIIKTSDYNTKIYYTVTYPNGDKASSNIDCLPPVNPYASWPPGYPTPDDPIWPDTMPLGVEPTLQPSGWVSPPRTWPCSGSWSTTVFRPAQTINSYFPSPNCSFAGLQGFSQVGPFVINYPVLGLYRLLTIGPCGYWTQEFTYALRGTCSGTAIVVLFGSAGIGGGGGDPPLLPIEVYSTFNPP